MKIFHFLRREYLSGLPEEYGKIYEHIFPKKYYVTNEIRHH